METKFTLETLQERIDKYLAGEKQDKPLLVWFDCPRDFELLNNRGYHNDPVGLADWYSEVYDKSIVNDKDTYHALTDEDFFLQRDKDGNPLTRVYISSLLPGPGDIRKKGKAVVEFTRNFNTKYGIPSLLFIQGVYKSDIEPVVNLIGYEQVVCSDEIATPEEFIEEFFKKAKEIHPATGRQRVDNFILDYLRQAPLTHITSTFDENERYGYDPLSECKFVKTTIATLSDYISASNDIYMMLCRIFEYKFREDSLKAELRSYVGSLYVNGSLSLDKMEKAVNEIPDDIWNAWCKRHRTFFRVVDKIPTAIDFTDRRAFMVLRFIEKAVEQRTDDVAEGFLKYYNMK